MDDVLKALQGNPELEQQMGRNLERNRDNLWDFGVPSQKEGMSCAAALIASSNSCGR